ncbi:MAG TPA: hypothetical protein PLS67_06525 [Accumulibacter sp.]|jgi:hypothetical protein|nr:hypothetical protein [Accumulibacter sp.]HQC80165.1 hypothetical protein [Accumulibacter sp.]
MKPLAFDRQDRTQSAPSLLAKVQSESAKDGELMKRILEGTEHLDSWMIANRILPALPEIPVIDLSLTPPENERITATFAPLPDGSAFGRNVKGIWLALTAVAAQGEIEYIGQRYAAGNRWHAGFRATIRRSDSTLFPLAPLDLAKIWEKTTGVQPKGFDIGLLDQAEAYSLNALDTLIDTQGQLGL